MGGKKARLAREAEEQARAESQRRKRWIAAGGLLVLVGLIGFAAVRWLLEPVATDVRGRLGGVHELSFLEGVQDGGGISPVCGCAHPRLHAWRGVEFAGRQVTLRHSGSPWTQWMLSSAEPDAVSLAGGLKVVHAKAYRVEVPGHFDPFAFLNHRWDGAVLDSLDVEAEKLAMLTHKELRIGLSGPVPIGAWIPFPGSSVELTATHSPFPEVPRRPRLIEHYPRRIGFWPDGKGTEHPKERQVYPVGDFLGPNLVLWTDDPGARIVGTRFGTPQAGAHVVTVLVISASVFSTRIAAVPAFPTQVASSQRFSLEERESYAEYVFDASGTTGAVALTVDEPLSQSDYQSVVRRVRSDPKTWTRIPRHPEYEGRIPERGFIQEQRFPPLPRVVGFNVFGPLRRIDFTHVHGDLTVGDDHVDLSGSADLQLNDVQAFRNSEDEQLISAPLSTTADAVDLDFEAHGAVSVDGVAQATARSEYEAPLRAIALVISLIGAVLGLAKGLRWGRSPQG